MKRHLSVFLICLISFNLFSIDLSKIKIGDSKASLVKQYGTPFKEIKNGKFEYDVWLDKKDIWLASFEDDKVATEPMLLDDFLNTLLDLSNAFADLGNSFSNWNVDDTSNYSTDAVSSTTKKTESAVKVDKSLLKSIDITILECKIFNKSYDPTPGYRLKVKNNSDKEISKLIIVLYFYDKKGKVFFENECTLIDSESYYNPKNLKPNYSTLVPESSSSFISVSGMDIEEWDEGKVTYEVVELK